MRHIERILFIILFIPTVLLAAERQPPSHSAGRVILQGPLVSSPEHSARFTTQSLEQFLKEHGPYSDGMRKKIENGDIAVQTNVTSNSKEKWQAFHYFITGLHKKSCREAFRKLSLYEQYRFYLPFVTQSTYDEKTQTIFLAADHMLMPFPMTLTFKLPRVTDVGEYAFVLDHGLFSDLQGRMHVYHYQNRCLFYATADWKGTPTVIPDSILSFFSEALTKLAMEKLFRLSTY